MCKLICPKVLTVLTDSITAAPIPAPKPAPANPEKNVPALLPFPAKETPRAAPATPEVSIEITRAWSAERLFCSVLSTASNSKTGPCQSLSIVCNARLS